MAEYTFNQLVDIAQVRQLLESHHTLSGMAYSVFDTEVNCLMSVGWQEICVRFHRVNPFTCMRCHESDAYINAHLHNFVGDFHEYRCKNGMLDIAMPIFIDGKHLATFFTGQFFYDDDLPDRDFFAAQAATFGFDRDEYLAALKRVPVFSRDYIRNNLLFLHHMVQILAENGLKNLRLASEMEERKAAQAMLDDERVLLKTLIQTLPDPVWLKDANGVFLACNAAFGRLFDDSPSGIVGRKDNDYVDDELAAFFQQKDRETIATGRPRTNEEWVTYAADGRRALWETTKTPVCDAQGRVVGALGVARDITEHKRLEDELRIREQYQRALLDNFPFMVWLKDTESRLLSVNRAYLETADLPHDAPYFGKTDLDLFPAELAECYRADDREVMRTGTNKTVEELVGVPGMLRWHETYKAPVYDADGKLLGTVGFARDIAERKRMEDALRESERKFRTLTENIPDLIVRYDRALRRTYVNPAWEAASGLSAAEVVLVPAADIPRVPTPVAATYMEKIQLVLTTGIPERIEFTWVNARGAALYLEYAIVPEHDRHGEISGVLAVGHDLTERKRMEEQLRDSEERLRLTLEATRIGIWDWNVERDEWHASPMYYSMLGYEPKEGPADRSEWLERIHPDDRTCVHDKLRDVLTRDVNEYEYEARLRHADGSYRWQYVRGFGIRRNAVGRVTRMLGIRMDITERRRSEELIRRREEEVRALVENSPDYIVRYDRECRRLYVNPALERLFELPSRKLEGGKPTDGSPLCEAENYERNLREVWQSGRERQLEHPFRTGSGEVRMGHYRIVPEFGPDGAIASVLAIGRDITELKQVETQLLQRERQYRELSGEFQTLLDGIPDLIIHVSPRMTVKWANRAAMLYLGGDVEGKDFHALFCDGASTCERCPIIRAFASGENEEELIIDKGGRYWGVKAFPLKDQQGRVVSVIDYATDITEKMHLRDTAAQARHLAALGELSAGVAHEINNPNGVILLNSAFLQRVCKEMTPLLAASTRRRRPLLVAGMAIDEVLREMPLLLSEVHDGARRIQRIVDGLKEFVRTPVADPEPVDLNSVVAAAIRITATQIEAATAHFTATYGVGVEAVQGSRQAIEQVVINLLTNACHALPDRERGIWVSTRLLAESGKAMIEVRDAGSGILPENLPHITDPFFTTRRQSGGTGLGLSISNSLIKECGGTLQFFSSPGAGTTVKVTLPLWKTKDKS